MGKADKDINLLYSYEISRKKTTTTGYKKLFTAFVIEASIIIAATSFLLITNTIIKSKNTALEAQVKTYIGVERKLEDFNTIKGLYDQKKSSYDTIADINAGTLKTIETLEKILPKEMSIEGLSLKDNKINFIIKSSKDENIAQFISNMQKTEYFKNITIDGVTNDKDVKRTSINADIARK